MEKRKTVEEYEKLAESLAQARDDASDVANRALRENQLLRQELKPLVERLLVGRGVDLPPEDGTLIKVKMERDQLRSFVGQLQEVLNGFITVDEFEAQGIGLRHSRATTQEVVRSNIVVLIRDAQRYRVQLNEALAKIPNPRPSAPKPPRKKAKRKRR